MGRYQELLKDHKLLKWWMGRLSEIIIKLLDHHQSHYSTIRDNIWVKPNPQDVEAQTSDKLLP